MNPAILSSPASGAVSSHSSVMQSHSAAKSEQMDAGGSSGMKQPVLERERRVEKVAKLIGGTLLPGGYYLADRIIVQRMTSRLHSYLERAFSEETGEQAKLSRTTRDYIHSLIDRDVHAQVSHEMRESLLDHSLFEIGGLLIVFLSSSSETLTSGIGNAAVCYAATKIFELLQNRRHHREHDIPGQINAIVRLRSGNALWSHMVCGR